MLFAHDILESNVDFLEKNDSIENKFNVNLCLRQIFLCSMYNWNVQRKMNYKNSRLRLQRIALTNRM